MFETLQKSPEDWNHPAWPRRVVPVFAAAGAVVASIGADAAGYHSALGAGLGAGLAVILGWFVLAALD